MKNRTAHNYGLLQGGMTAILMLVISLFATSGVRAATTPARGFAITPGQASNEQEFNWSGRLGAGQSIEIKGINGWIKAEPSSGDSVEVTAIKKGRRDDPSQVEIRVVEHSGGVTICALYPDRDADRPNECVPGSGGQMNTSNNDVQVEFTVRVPSGVGFIGRNVNGGVEASSLSASVEAYTVNGGIRISTSGPAIGSTVNGSIKVEMGEVDPERGAEFTTVNGSIELRLPDNASANVSAETLNGPISTDFPVTVQGTFGRKHLNGTIGAGGPELRLKTVNGSIKLRRLS